MILFDEDTTFLLKPDSALASVKGCDWTQFKCIVQYTFHLGGFPIANIVQKLFISETGKLWLEVVQFTVRVYLIWIMKPF